MKCIVSGYGVSLDTSIAAFGERSFAVWSDGIESPSFVVCGDGYLFAITENTYYAGIYAYKQEGLNAYRLSDRRGLEGGALCHIAYSAKHHMLFGACYASGTIFHVDFTPETGLFGEVKIIYQTGDEGVISRAHCTVLNKAEDRLFVANLGLDRLYVYAVTDGALDEVKIVEMPKGIGPRHIRLSKDESRLYVITEYSNEIYVYDTADWSLLQVVSALPEGYVSVCHCSTLCISPDERFLYAANRYADTISVFAMDESKLLSFKGMFDCGGRSPRHMELSPDGKQLVICCQDSDWVVFKHLDPETGMATHTVREIPFYHPACVVMFD